MKKYIVTVAETLKLDVEVEANSLDEAQRKVEDKYKNSDIILLPDDFDSVDFSVKEAPAKKKHMDMER